jgi:NADH:ubiquinone oxidoreductase subunit E
VSAFDPAAEGSLLERPAVPRFGHGSRVPGWDRAADLEKDPATIPDPGETGVSEELRARIEAHMANYPDRRSAALPALAAAQRVHGWCSPEAIAQVASVMRVTPAYLESVATFYDMLENEPVGRHSVYVCTNISCSLRGADRIYELLREAAVEDPDVNVRAFECLGACDIAPMASVDGVYVGPLGEGDVHRLLAELRGGEEVLSELQLVRRLSADPHANSREFPRHPPVHDAGAGGATPEMPPQRAAYGETSGERGAGAPSGPGPQAAPGQATDRRGGSS